MDYNTKRHPTNLVKICHVFNAVDVVFGQLDVCWKADGETLVERECVDTHGHHTLSVAAVPLLVLRQPLSCALTKTLNG